MRNIAPCLLCKSKFGLNRIFSVKFDEIDTPTEKERAEINEIQARTDATLVQAGVIAPDEVRQKLINSENSGYNGIDEEYQEMPDLETEEGNGETQQNPFSVDQWKEGDPRKANGQFGEGGSSSKEDKKQEQKSSKYDKIDYSQFEEIPIAKNEKEMVRHALNNDLTPEERKKKIIVRSIRNWRYTIINNGFDDYTIIDVEDQE